MSHYIVLTGEQPGVGEGFRCACLSWEAGLMWFVELWWWFGVIWWRFGVFCGGLGYFNGPHIFSLSTEVF